MSGHDHEALDGAENQEHDPTPGTDNAHPTGKLSRRHFLAGATAVGLASLPIVAIGCRPQAESSTTTEKEGGPSGTEEKTPPQRDMDELSEERVKAFPAETGAHGNQPIKARVENGVKVFDLTASEVEWEVEPGQKIKAMAYNKTVPGPLLRVTEGDKVKINFKNDLPHSTSIHWHGVLLPNNMDGVPYITQPPVKSGESFTYEFTAKNPGSHMYHSHHDAATQVPGGLLGAFIIDPKDKSIYPAADIDQLIILNDGPLGFTLNGKSFPATQPIAAKLGQKVRLRFMNEGLMIHPMHLHGLVMEAFAKDGWPLPQNFKCDTINIAPGERWDVLVNCDTPGTWALHCHILTHAERADGMFGMVTAIVVK